MYGPEAISELPTLMKVRQQQAYGACTDYFKDNQNCVAFVRHGEEAHTGSGCVVLCANAKPGYAFCFQRHAAYSKRTIPL